MQIAASVEEDIESTEVEIVGENLDDALHQVFLGNGIPTINDLKRVKNKPKRGMCNWCGC